MCAGGGGVFVFGAGSPARRAATLGVAGTTGMSSKECCALAHGRA